ncbi:MAG: hypothetical protein LBQ44_05675 [Treponema sp.]|nr:hypothetical protein [Treponema sp.]
MPNLGGGYEIDAIIIAILGGALFGYAAIHIASTAIAALLLAMMGNFFNLIEVSWSVQSILKIVVLFIGFIPIFIKGASAQSLGIAGLVLGILSVIGGWIPLVNYFTWVLAVIGIALSAIARKNAAQANEPTGVATAGLALSIIGLVIPALRLIYVVRWLF